MEHHDEKRKKQVKSPGSLRVSHIEMYNSLKAVLKSEIGAFDFH